VALLQDQDLQEWVLSVAAVQQLNRDESVGSVEAVLLLLLVMAT
jgi:hypothetical protein